MQPIIPWEASPERRREEYLKQNEVKLLKELKHARKEKLEAGLF
jgi:hypothetical protein